MARKIERYVCPFCCKAVDPVRLHRACGNPECTAKFIRKARPAERARRVSAFAPGMEIDVEASIYRGIDPRTDEAITTARHIVYNPRDRRCDMCGKVCADALCPVCHSPVPPDADEGGNIIAVLGAKRSGKSTYTASLIEVMQESYCKEYGVEMRPAVPRTEEVFGMLRERVLNADYEGPCTAEPMVYYLEKQTPAGRRVQTLALFDNEGADMETEGRIEALSTGTLITGAAGILFLVDPLSLGPVREKLRLPDNGGSDPAARLEEVADTIRLQRHQTRRTVDVPLAVVLTKVDALMRLPTFEGEEEVLLGPESALNIPRERGVYDAENLMQVSAEIEEYLRRNAGERFLKAVRRFRNHAFFAASALGHQPGYRAIPEPFRVEDPIVWMSNTKED